MTARLFMSVRITLVLRRQIRTDASVLSRFAESQRDKTLGCPLQFGPDRHSVTFVAFEDVQILTEN